MLRIDVPVWFNAVCYMSVTVKGKTVKLLLLVFVTLRTQRIVVAFQETIRPVDSKSLAISKLIPQAVLQYGRFGEKSTDFQRFRGHFPAIIA